MMRPPISRSTKPPPINSLWIFSLAIVHFSVALYFGYYFLFSEELHIGGSGDHSVEDELVQDHQPPSWIRHVLGPSSSSSSSSDPLVSSQIIVSQPHSQYIFLDNYCNRTLSQSKPKFSKFVLFIIDAFRVDFVPSILANTEILYENPRLPYMEQIMKTHGIGLVSIASIPTVTLPRIKALLSGTIPSFIDYIMNLSAYKFQSDNLVEQFWRQNKKIVFYGDDTWAKLFSPSIFHRCNVTSSLFATDYTEVDSNVTYNVNRELRNLQDWDVMIAHYLGVDHIGHLRGYHSDLFNDKLTEMDNVFRSIFDTLIYNENNNDTYLIAIAGDHGMTNSGNHGGNTRDETHTALLFISTNKSHSQFVNPFSSDQSVGQQDKVSLQIDFASTVASLFAYKFPSKSQGRLISPVLERFGMGDDEHLCLLFRNAFQIQKVIMKKMTDDSISSSKVFDTLKGKLIEALNSHYNFVNQESSEDKREKKYFELAKSSYHHFIHQLQQQHLNKVQNRSFLSSLSLSIGFCFVIILVLFWLEMIYNRSASILAFDELIENYPTIFQPTSWFSSIYSIFGEEMHTNITPTTRLNLTKLFSHLRYFSSCFGRLIVLVSFVLNFVLMGSTSFMEMEHWYWHYVVATILVGKLLVTIRGYLNFYRSNFKSSEIKQHYLKVIFSLLIVIVIFKFLLIQWKIPIINEADLRRFTTSSSDSSGTKSYTMDIHSWLIRKESKHYLSAMFIVSLIGIAFLASKFRLANGDRFSSAKLGRSFYIFGSGLFWIYIYRSQTGSVSVFRPPLVKNLFGGFGSRSPNLYAQIVFFHLFLLWCDCIMKHTKHSILPNFLIQKLALLTNSIGFLSRNNRNSTTTTTNSAKATSFLNTFQLSWILMSTLLLESYAVPVLMLNILLEKLLYFVMSQPDFLQQLSCARGRTLESGGDTEEELDGGDFNNPQPIQYRQLFYRLVCYLALASSSFYQIGNTNSLSTVGVNACFVGLGSYQPIICGIFMTISMFSSYVFWIVTYFIRLEQDLFRYNCNQQAIFQHKQSSSDNAIVEQYYSVSQLDQLRTDTDATGSSSSSSTSHPTSSTSQQLRIVAGSRIKQRIVQNYCTFYSVVNILLIIRMAILTQNMAISFILRDHLFIWSVICPKFLYEMCFTIVSHLLICLMVLLFSLDNCFMLNNLN